jgi:WD40 repeat protein
MSTRGGGHTGPIRDVAFSPVGNGLATVSDDRTVRGWHWEASPRGIVESPHVWSGVGHGKKVDCVAWSADGQYIASGSQDATVRLWVAKNGSLATIFADHTQRVLSVAFSRESDLLAV